MDNKHVAAVSLSLSDVVPDSCCSCLIVISGSVLSAELVSDKGLPEVETLGLLCGLNLPELST